MEEVIALIKKHEAFEKSAQAQDERFLALEKLTNFELKELQRREHADEEERRHRGIKHRGSRGGETTFFATGEVASRSHEGKICLYHIYIRILLKIHCG